MELFVEKEFFEEFELDYYCSEFKTEIQGIIYSLFSEFTKVNLFTNASVDFITECELLSKFTDNNLKITFNFDFDNYFDNQSIFINQTLIFTKTPKNWFPSLKEKGALCFSYIDYENEIESFIYKTHFKVDLSDIENIPIKWNIFKFLNQQTNFIIITDSYILCDRSGQRLKDNLIPLLKENLDEKHFYSIFIITVVDAEIDKKLRQIYSSLGNYKVKIYVFNRISEIENIVLHDRILYSNYTITDSGKGFNLNSLKPVNSQILSASLFDKYTYKRFNNHLKELKTYIAKLEKFNKLNNPYKTNTIKAFEAFRELAIF
jgi:hypothetical protein